MLAFAATPVPAGQARDFFLLSRGVYTSVQPALEQQTPGTAPPVRFALLQNQPNPFARTTSIRFEMPRPSKVRLDIFDLEGRRVSRLADALYPAGRWSLEWDHRDGGGAVVQPGVYLYRIAVGSFRDQKKMVLPP